MFPQAVPASQLCVRVRQHIRHTTPPITTQHREWQAQLQVVLDSQCVGMLRLETGALKATYSNTLSSAQATVTMMMVVAGRRAAEGAIDRLQAVTRCVV